MVYDIKINWRNFIDGFVVVLRKEMYHNNKSLANLKFWDEFDFQICYRIK